MKTEECLTVEETWQADGCVTQLALIAFVDGQEKCILSQAQSHIESCESCSLRLGELAEECCLTHEAFTPLAIHVPMKSVPLETMTKIPWKVFSFAATFLMVGTSMLIPYHWANWMKEARAISSILPGLLARMGGLLYRFLHGQGGWASSVCWLFAVVILLTFVRMVSKMSKFSQEGVLT